MDEKTQTYANAGVDYEKLDALKRFAQMMASETVEALPQGMADVPESLGESARVIDIGPFFLATTQEGLGTKNLVADAVDPSGSEGHYHKLAKDTVAMVVNDLITVGARPLMVNAHWSFGSTKILEDHPIIGQSLARGWADACREAGAMYAAGETPVLRGIIYPETIELSGSAVGIINPKDWLTLGKNLMPGDHVVLIESNGVHANGITLIRRVAEALPLGYSTSLSSGRALGEAILKPTHIYARLVNALFSQGVAPHYMVHMTGHGWRKIMRANRDFTYRMHMVPSPHEEFGLIQQTGNIPDRDMYDTFNMGAGFAFIVCPQDAEHVSSIALELGFQSWDAGIVEEGPKQIVIEPIGVTYTAETLQIR